MSLLDTQTQNNVQTSCNAAASEGSGCSSAIRYEHPKYRIHESETDYVAELDVPGASKKDVEISVEDGVLEVVARRSSPVDSSWKPVAGFVESLAYRLRLAVDDGVEVEGIKASVDSGVLRVSLPKLEERKPRKIVVN